MREILFRGKLHFNNKWVYGSLIQTKNKDNVNCTIIGENIWSDVDSKTVGQYTGLIDKNCTMIFEGDIVDLFVFCGEVVQINGAFGIKAFINYDYLTSEIEGITGCNNYPAFCENDNFVSLWELMWNYNQEENCCGVVEVIGNIHDNPELLEV